MKCGLKASDPSLFQETPGLSITLSLASLFTVVCPPLTPSSCLGVKVGLYSTCHPRLHFLFSRSIWSSVYPSPPPNCWARRPWPVRASREAEEGPARLLRLLLPSCPQPLAQRPSHALPPQGPKPPAQEPQQLRCPRQTQKRRSQPFPRSPRRGLLPVCGPQEAGRGEAPRCYGDAPGAGEGRPDDNDRFEAALGLAPLCLDSPVYCVPLKRQGKERENSAVKLVFVVSQTLSHALSHVIDPQFPHW